MKESTKFVPPPFDKLLIKSKDNNMKEVLHASGPVERKFEIAKDISEKTIRVLTTPVIVQDGRITFQSVEISCIVFEGTNKEISVYFDPSREPKYSQFLGGRGWCTPPWEKINQAELNGNEIPYSIVVCKCQKNFTEDDILHLQEFGHTSDCNLFHTVIHAAKLPEPPFPLTPLKSPEKSPEFIPDGGLASDQLEGIKQFLEGAEGSIVDAIESLNIPIKGIDANVVEKQLARFYSFTTCSGCGCWGEVASPNNPKCINCTIQGL